jgi:three-Cys-motif partner protein
MTKVVYSTRTFQGASRYTERKEFEIGGLVQMRLRQLKGELPSRHYSEIVIADVFSGSGENIVSATDDPIDGSPLRLLWALETSIMTKAGPNPMALARKPVRLLFSDIRPDAISKLNQVVADRWSPVGGVVPQINTAVLSAESAIALLRDHMDNAPSAHLILVLDPNGPKDFPRDGVLDLLAAHGKRIDLIPYISATAINRCLRHREQCGATYDWWLSAIDRFDTGFVNAIANGRGGWVRMPIEGDPQRWLMLPTFTPRLLPRNDWAKQGYVEINSPKGQTAIAAYAGIKEAS